MGEGDLAAQTAQAFINLATALNAAGATFSDVTKLTTYVVDWTPEKMGSLVEGVMQAGQQVEVDMARPITLIGVSALGEPDLLIEVEAIAVLP